MSGIGKSEAYSRAEKLRLLKSFLKQKAQSSPAGMPRDFESAFLADAQLDASIEPCGSARHADLHSTLLLTGATGFLGAHLLHDLCRLTKGKIHCLVRARGAIEAWQRLQQNIARYIDFELPVGRVVPIVGDLAEPGLGLPVTSWDRLACEVDAIFHNGAALNHLASYERLRASNVASTVELLRFAAAARRPKWMYYVSSIIAAAERDGDGLLAEELPTGRPSGITGGYAQTKWVSESLLGQARQRGFGVTVYRPGIVGGRRDSGAWAVGHDHLLLLLKSCIQMGYAAQSDLPIDLTPVDFVSEAIVRTSLDQPQHPVFHLSNPEMRCWNTLVQWMIEFGFPLKVVPFSVWQDHLSHIDHTNALFPLLSVYLEASTADKRQMLIAKLADVSRAVTRPVLVRLGLQYPAVDRQLWAKYVSHCCRIGFLPSPGPEVAV